MTARISGGAAASDETRIKALALFREAEVGFAELGDSKSLFFADLQSEIARTLAADGGQDPEVRAEAIAALKLCDQIYRSKNRHESVAHLRRLRHLVELLGDQDCQEDLAIYRPRLQRLEQMFPDE